MTSGSELDLKLIGKWWETSFFITHQGVHFLNRWKTQSGIIGAASKVARLPATDHLSHPLASTSPPLPPSPSASISCSSAKARLTCHLLPAHSRGGGGLHCARVQAAALSQSSSLENRAGPKAFWVGPQQLSPHPGGEWGHGAPLPLLLGPCQGPELSPPFCRGPSPSMPLLASPGDNLTSSGTQC